MAKPVLVLVDDEDAGRHALARELESRYGAHYWIVSSPSPESALARLTGFRDEGVAVPLVLADHWMPGMTGTEFLARVKDIVPTARRGLLISWGDPSTSGPILEASALGQMEFYVPKPVWSPDEQFHRAITESLDEWWREQGGRFEAVTVIGEEPSVRTHEIRDILARNSVPFGFYRSDSAEGRQALARLGLDQPAGPVVALFNRIVLVDPGNAEVAEALGVDVRPARSADTAFGRLVTTASTSPPVMMSDRHAAPEAGDVACLDPRVSPKTASPSGGWVQGSPRPYRAWAPGGASPDISALTMGARDFRGSWEPLIPARSACRILLPCHGKPAGDNAGPIDLQLRSPGAASRDPIAKLWSGRRSILARPSRPVPVSARMLRDRGTVGLDWAR
jgi:CheY-like chemotaxis protein